MRCGIIAKLERGNRQKRANIEYKVDMGSDGNLLPLGVFKILFPKATLEYI